ncbi:MAG: bifunctional diaminohydroxyphosphoribosylaminopyrimidine deaminase/5-amino-6-(5-phosphoribosylamino)uracil reductase RibD [Gemmobacter sp.]
MSQADPETDAAHMRHALGLGARGLGLTWPNPAVGCVILAGGRVVGRGWTQPGGRPHAEAMALAQAGAQAQGATAYVTLEPCAHHGRTPPCADALVAAGLARVVTGTTDPDPRVAGRGHAILRAGGVAVTEGVLRAEAEAANAGFFARIRAGRPMVTLKLALSLDGRIANAAGAARWITGPEARRMVHALRARHDAVMVGIGTALADDPDLTVRDLGMARQLVRVVLDTRARLPAGSHLARTARAVPVWLVHGAGAVPDPALTAAGVRPLAAAAAGGRIDPADALARLGGEGLTRVFCEGGGQVAAALLAAGLVDEIVAFTGGHAFGAGGTPSLGPLAAATTLPDPPDWRLIETRPVGRDVLHRWRRG